MSLAHPIGACPIGPAADSLLLVSEKRPITADVRNDGMELTYWKLRHRIADALIDSEDDKALDSITVVTSHSTIESSAIGPPSSNGQWRKSFTCLCIAHIGLGLALFLATTDTTIISTSLPTIVDSLGSKESQYSWPGVAYLLPQTALQPLFPRFSDVLGRKSIMFFSIVIFLLASVLCGFAHDMTWLTLGRALQGAGSGGIVSSVWVLTTEIVPAEDRAKWSQALSLTWSSSAIAGPLLGGVFSQGGRFLSWRWGFFVNVPIGLFGSAILILCLPQGTTKSCPDFVLRRLPSNSVTLSRKQVWRHIWQYFDFIGLFLLVGGSTALIIGFNMAASKGWSSPLTYSMLVVGVALLVTAGFYEAATSRDALLPPQLFRTETTVAVLLISFLHNAAFTTGTFFLALYYQTVHGATPLMAGVRSLPYSLGSALASMPTAWYISWRPSRVHHSRREVMAMGMAISSLGFGLMILLDENTAVGYQETVPLIAGIGVGMLFHTPYGTLTEAMSAEDLASTTGAFFLVRFIGSTTGLAIANAIFNSTLQDSLPAGSDLSDYSAQALRGLVNIQDPGARSMVLHAVSRSIQRIWIFCTPCMVTGCIASIFISAPSKASEGARQEDLV